MQRLTQRVLLLLLLQGPCPVLERVLKVLLQHRLYQLPCQTWGKAKIGYHSLVAGVEHVVQYTRMPAEQTT